MIGKMFILLVLGALFVACDSSSSTAPQQGGATAVGVSNVQSAATSTSAPAATSAPAPAPTSGAVPAATSTPTTAPTSTSTPTPAPTATSTATSKPLNPLAIPAMRQRDYPGSDIVIEGNLPAGANYQRYYVSYKSEGLKIYAMMTVPNGQKPASGWPVVIFNHGFIQPSIYRTTERYVAYLDYFARAGYIVLKSDYRGHGSSEGVAAGGYGTPDYTVDVLNGMASVMRYKDADPNRVGMWGHSMGGQATLRASVVSKSIKAAVIWAGVVDSYPDMLVNWNANNNAPNTSGTARGWRATLARDYGSPQENPEFWASISPNSYLAEGVPPTQLHHGTIDHSVPLKMSENLTRQLKAAGQTVEFYSYPGDDHNIEIAFGVAMARSLAWFNRYVKGS